jgi:hypothetical protein
MWKGSLFKMEKRDKRNISKGIFQEKGRMIKAHGEGAWQRSMAKAYGKGHIAGGLWHGVKHTWTDI